MNQLASTSCQRQTGCPTLKGFRCFAGRTVGVAGAAKRAGIVVGAIVAVPVKANAAVVSPSGSGTPARPPPRRASEPPLSPYLLGSSGPASGLRNDARGGLSNHAKGSCLCSGFTQSNTVRAPELAVTQQRQSRRTTSGARPAFRCASVSVELSDKSFAGGEGVWSKEFIGQVIKSCYGQNRCAICFNFLAKFRLPYLRAATRTLAPESLLPSLEFPSQRGVDEPLFPETFSRPSRCFR
ncbi:hypothetical protein VNO77_04151 [Canavalia gladiata]|uniref:Uncharacterized protein n=1 Tax=Canavalia gladiata TaxID=3824 RepID=A0AAN9MY31_CANGL